MIDLYKKLGEYGISVAFEGINEYQIVQVTFKKNVFYAKFTHTYETAENTKQFERYLISDLYTFMDLYDQNSIKMNRAMDLREWFKRHGENKE